MTRIEILLVMLLVAVALGLLVPVVFQGRGRVKRIQCASNLRSIAGLAAAYADEHGGVLPCADGAHPRAFESLQRIVDYDTRYRDPSWYVCPASDEIAATPDSDTFSAIPDGSARFRLTERNVSYAWIAAPAPTRVGRRADTRPLACDHSLVHHETGIWVLNRDCSMRWTSRKELEEGHGGFEAFLKANGLTK